MIQMLFGPWTGLVWVVASALCYFYQNTQMFRLMNLLTHQKNSVWKWNGLTFAITYCTFLSVSFLQLPLVLNWWIIAVVYVLLVKLIYKVNLQSSVCCGLIAATVGLGANSITRSLTALVLNIPFSQLDTRTGGEMDNVRQYPVMIGFLLAGFLFWILYRQVRNKQPYLADQAKRSGRFAICLLVSLYGYLCLNLLIYFTANSDWVLKVWGLKSGVFALAGLWIGLHYMAQAERTRIYEQKSRQARRALDNQKVSEQILERRAYTDFLTDCYNRQYGIKTLQSLCARGETFRLCFVDADGLKKVNDKNGHEAGDQYLCAVSDALKTMLTSDGDLLCRYGGDEFLVILTGCGEDEYEARRSAAEKDLAERSALSGMEDPFTVSFGMAGSEEGNDPCTLIQIADQNMYREKQLKQ